MIISKKCEHLWEIWWTPHKNQVKSWDNSLSWEHLWRCDPWRFFSTSSIWWSEQNQKDKGTESENKQQKGMVLCWSKPLSRHELTLGIMSVRVARSRPRLSQIFCVCVCAGGYLAAPKKPEALLEVEIAFNCQPYWRWIWYQLWFHG